VGCDIYSLHLPATSECGVLCPSHFSAAISVKKHTKYHNQPLPDVVGGQVSSQNPRPCYGPHRHRSQSQEIGTPPFSIQLGF